MLADDMFVYGDQNIQVPAHLNFGKFILDRLRSHSDKVAFEQGQTRETITYKLLTQYAVNVASVLIKLGVKRGDIVGVGSEPRFEFVATNIAVVFTGATYTPFDRDSGRGILTHKLNLTKPSYMICSKQFWQKNKEVIIKCNCIKKCITIDDGVESFSSVGMYVINDVDVNKFEPVQVQGQVDTACILYSSGTTGMSKGVQLSHLNCILNSLSDKFNDESLKAAFVYGEWYHNYDSFMTYKFLAMGKRIVYLSNSTTQGILKCIDDCKINIAFLVPCSIIEMIKENETEMNNLDSLKIIYSRAAPLHRKTITQIKYRFPNVKFIYQGYGMTEAGELTSECWGSKGPKYGSVGMASPGITIKVCPMELEAVLQLHPGVREAGVIGRPVPIYGEEPTAFVVKQPGVNVTEQDLVEYVSTQVPDYMQLRGGVKFIDKIPKNSRGKIIRQRLQEILR